MNEASAPEHVRKHFTASVLPRREADPRIAAAADLVMKPPLPPSVTRRPAAEIAKSLADIGAKGKDSPIFDGSLKALAGKTNCLLVHYHGLLGGGVAACVDIPTGEILAMWQLPEG